MSTIPIGDLVDRCERMAATNRALFERLGSWVPDEPDPATQQWFAVACHRHAWHAELWDERRPKVPIDCSSGDDVHLPPAGHDGAAWYRERLGVLHDELADLEAEVDATLDPSTARVIALVTADIADLSTAGPTLS